VSDGLDPGLQKIAIFVNSVQWVTHAAIQLESGMWASKLGVWEDIRHPLRQLEGIAYGNVALIMSRPRPGVQLRGVQSSPNA